MEDRPAIPYPSLRPEEEDKEDAKQAKEVVAAMQTMLDRPELLDVTFVCTASKEVRANRALLAGRSEYFSKMLYGDMKEGSMDRIPLPEVQADSLQTVISYLHGCPLRWKPDTCWEGVLDTYMLAEQYQVNSLCERVLLWVSRLGYASELGELLNAAIPRQADDILKIALTVMNDVLVVDSTTFRGWSKESIVYCLDNARFHPNVTETLVAEAVLSAVSDTTLLVDNEETKTAPEQPDSPAAEEPMDSVAPAAGSEKETGVKDSDTAARKVLPSGEDVRAPEVEEVSPAKESIHHVESRETSEKDDGTDEDCDAAEREVVLSRKDVEDIFKGHINLPSIESSFLQERIEPLRILRLEALLAAYRVQGICFTRGVPPSSFFTMPWRSMCHKPPFAPVETRKGGIRNAYNKVLFPSLWSIRNEKCESLEEVPQRVVRSDTKYDGLTMMKLHFVAASISGECGS
ncbi:hypothetical protein CBR_g28476 [Chara braunii]|uniref:BTB domain-containing protein n=1 Tax=Chara braunii TaxID=69332 RepID=A0A388JW03_CHABU|nr:hypothetical protein CBR_g28476 [Chara braunii]|eukprot:GBG61999.1 hypothetical protein CBR_g28476 [Chara braunii]